MISVFHLSSTGYLSPRRLTRAHSLFLNVLFMKLPVNIVGVTVVKRINIKCISHNIYSQYKSNSLYRTIIEIFCGTSGYGISRYVRRQRHVVTRRISLAPMSQWVMTWVSAVWEHLSRSQGARRPAAMAAAAVAQPYFYLSISVIGACSISHVTLSTRDRCSRPSFHARRLRDWTRARMQIYTFTATWWMMYWHQDRVWIFCSSKNTRRLYNIEHLTVDSVSLKK